MAKKTNFTYIVSLEGGAEEGPLNLADLKPMLREGRVVGSTFIKRSDRADWSTAADFPELKVKDDVGGKDPFAADAVTQEICKELGHRKVRAGVSWLFWIGALSLLNSGLALLGLGLTYAMGLGSSHLIAALGDWFGNYGMWISLGANVGMALGFLIVGVLAWHGRPWLLGPAVVVYVADTIFCGMFQLWMSVALHAVALLFLVPGFIASFEARGREINGRIWLTHGLAAAVLSGLGFGAFMYLEKAGTPEPAAWAATSQKQWPQVSVANAAEFKGHTPLAAGNAFFIRTKENKVFAGTALHLLGVDGGVEPPIKIAELDKVLTKWNLTSRTSPVKTARVHGLHASPDNYRLLHDWVLLQVEPEDIGKLPAEGLSPRFTVLKKAEVVYVVGAGASGTAQEIHSAKIVDSNAFGLDAEFDKPVDLVGFSGAPVIDSHGALVGVLTSTKAAPNRDGKFPSFIAESVIQVRKLLK